MKTILLVGGPHAGKILKIEGNYSPVLLIPAVEPGSVEWFDASGKPAATLSYTYDKPAAEDVAEYKFRGVQ